MTHLRSFACGLIAATATLVLCLPAKGQEAGLGRVKPSDLYFQAWLTVREAETAASKGNYLESFKRYDKAKQLFDSVAVSDPDFKPDLVRSRRDSTAKAMAAIRPQAVEQQEKLANRTGELIESPSSPPPSRDLSIPRVSREDQQKVSALQLQITQYRSELQKARSDRDANAVRLREALRQLEQERDRVARAPAAGQLQQLNQSISRIEKERDAMFKALQKSRSEHQELQQQLATAKADAAAAQQRASELEKVVHVQQSTAKEVVEDLRSRLQDLKEALAEKDSKYVALDTRNELLERQLGEARDEIRELRDERDSLLAERDQMTALLKLNESERVQLLIKQNMDLGRDLKTARERLKQLHTDNNVTKDQLIEAKRDLANAKGRLIEFQRENASQKNRLAALEDRIRKAGTDLKNELQVTSLDPKARQEMEMLRDIIARQLRIQEHRRTAKAAVMTEIRRIGQEDGPLVGNLKGLFEQELRLTAEESRLIEEFRIDDDFIFNDRPSRDEVASASRNLQARVSIKDQLARRAFSNGRYLAAREVFESILEEHPGHVESMLNLGVVHVKNDEVPLAISSFNDALVIRGDNLPFAHFMLGVCHYRLADLQSSKVSLRRAIELDRGNAKAWIFLGNVAGREQRDDEAEAHFKAAIEIDPTLSDPYYNLAVIYLRQGNKEEALNYYREALKRGADPNLEFEASLAQS
ncbi:MAG: hypothetical protein CMO40_01785 [Verrucomicrobiaceae bacterium]|nr:hypothetical protein [Verrucomicrobiaceae bacterium]